MKTLYTTNCPKCSLLEMLLKGAGEEYETIDLRKDQEALDRLTGQGYRSAPLLGLEDGTLLGFKDAQKLLREKKNG